MTVFFVVTGCVLAVAAFMGLGAMLYAVTHLERYRRDSGEGHERLAGKANHDA